MGKNYWGTKRVKAPEEYCYGAVIDEATNVYTLGAVLFNSFLVIIQIRRYGRCMKRVPSCLVRSQNGS